MRWAGGSVGRCGLLALLVVVSHSCGNRPVPTTRGPTAPTFTLFALADLRGQIEPCGCTTDPLGDLARTAHVLRDARKNGPVLVVDAGSLLYSQKPMPEHRRETEELKADLLASAYRDLGVAAVGLGPMDLVNSGAGVRLPRLAHNVAPTSDLALAAPTIVQAGVPVGLFGVVAPDVVAPLAATDPKAAGRQAVTQVRSQGAVVVVGLINAATKAAAVDIVRGIGDIDIAILGLGQSAKEPTEVSALSERVGKTILVMPANRGQVMSRLDITMRGKGPLDDAIGPAAATERKLELQAMIASLDRDLAAYKTDPTADPAFVASQQTLRDEAAAQQKQLEQRPLAIPDAGNYFVLEQIRIHRGLACDPSVVAAKQAFDAKAGEANVRAASAMPPVPVPDGTATYLGGAACATCHAPAMAFWQTTKHANAWATIETTQKQRDFECVGCHVTGWEKPGGATLGKNEPLRNVQCETCHGPGSKHAVSARPADIQRAPRESFCADQCHTKEHSDTFDYVPYLRDILGKGHGEGRRLALGDGPTGASLRAAGLAKAAKSIGQGCPK